MPMATMKTEYPVIVRPLAKEDGGGFLAEFPDLPGCISDGESTEEALRNAMEAKEAWLAAMHEAGRKIPAPESRGGKWVQRVSITTKRRLEAAARDEGVSLNALVSAFIAESLGRREGGSRPRMRRRRRVRRAARRKA
ncbi:MAG TPA: type II toxin-antitoxin system HicB family antitoxin [Myxococcota bacterium]|nr:type II toxin-antitoxin system HicB family antitoxin [Myxococcota bacterium]